MRLQRVLTDFGADCSFCEAAEKVHEHYGIDVPASTTRLKVEAHAKNMKTLNEHDVFNPGRQMADCIIVEADGGMVPMVGIHQCTQADGRRNRYTYWREGILVLARRHKAVQPYFYASMEPRETTGKHLAQCANFAGRNKQTKLHCLGDGAPWIAEQVETEFGADANFLIDFYHLSQYLAAAAQCINPDNPTAWLEAQKQLLLDGQTDEVFRALSEHMEAKGLEHSDCPVKKCFNYMDKRREYLNYKAAVDAGLPIGSGEIESGIRSIIQGRLKLPGAWWLEEKADEILALKTVRANGFWEQYWIKQKSPYSECRA
jgi:hypothetical protein